MLNLSCILTQEKENLICAWCPELDIASQDKTIDEAKNNLKEAVELYLEDEDVAIPQKTFEPLMTIIRVDEHTKITNLIRT